MVLEYYQDQGVVEEGVGDWEVQEEVVIIHLKIGLHVLKVVQHMV